MKLMHQTNKQLYFIPHRGYNIKWMAFVLQYIVIAYHEKYSGENEVKDNNDTKITDLEYKS